MPFYDLRCLDCDTESNVRASIEDKTARRIPCPKCNSLNMETVFSAAPAYIKSRGDSMPSCPSGNTCGNSGCRFAG